MERSTQYDLRRAAPTDGAGRLGACAISARLGEPRRARALVRALLAILAAVTLSALVAAAMIILAGCSRPERVLVIQPVAWEQAPPAEAPDSGPAAGEGNDRIVHMVTAAGPRSLIFPAEPGLTPVPADQIVRADWPTVAGRYSYGQTVYFQEHWYDRQAIGPYDIDYGYRIFRSTNEGMLMGD